MKHRDTVEPLEVVTFLIEGFARLAIQGIRHWFKGLWRRHGWPRCTQCQRRLKPWTVRHSEEFCSDRCFSRWLPF